MKTPQALIVEDVPDLADIFAHALQVAGYEVHILADGLLARSYLQKTIPDLLVLDIHLPHIRGDQLLYEVQQDPRFAQTKIIIVTADARRGVELNEEVDLVLQKPVSYVQLRDLSSRLTATMSHLHTRPLPNLPEERP